jgi:osmotically-inducible protein OsmY
MAAERHGPLRVTSLEQAIARETGEEVAAEQDGNVISLTGMVDSDEMHDAVLEVASAAAPGVQIDDDLEVVDYLPDQVGETAAEPMVDVTDVLPTNEDILGEVEPDFTDQPLLTDPTAAPGPSSSSPDLVEEGDEVYVPPIDPVITLDEQDDVEVLGGFAPDSMSSMLVERSAMDDRLGDEALAEAVRRELREDASTTDLRINVVVRNGVVRLRGRVAGIEDVENAEAVAGNVPGVRDVVEELEVPGL